MTYNPPIQVVDEDDTPVGQANINDVYAGELIHRVVYVIIEDPSAKRLLLQKRGPEVVNDPNRWDVSAAGHVDANEPYDTAAIRELFEELGIKGLKLQEVDYFRSDEKIQERMARRFCKIYKTVSPLTTAIKPQPGEVTTAEWFSLEQVKKLISDYPEDVAGGLFRCMERCYE